MDDKIKRIALLYKRGIYKKIEAWQEIVDIYTNAGFPCTLGTAEQVLEHFMTLV